MSDEPDLELVMPFVVVASAGGPFDDEAFQAGWSMAQLDAELQHAPARMATMSTVFRTACAPQADLIAMRWGYAVQIDMQDDDWTSAAIVHAPMDLEEDEP